MFIYGFRVIPHFIITMFISVENEIFDNRKIIYLWALHVLRYWLQRIDTQ